MNANLRPTKGAVRARVCRRRKRDRVVVGRQPEIPENVRISMIERGWIAEGEALDQIPGEACFRHLLLDGGYVVFRPVVRDDPHVGVVDRVAGPVVPVAGLAYSARIDDHSVVAQAHSLVQGELVEDSGVALGPAYERPVRVADQAPRGVEEGEVGGGSLGSNDVLEEGVTRATMDQREALHLGPLWQTAQVRRIVLAQDVDGP